MIGSAARAGAANASAAATISRMDRCKVAERRGRVGQIALDWYPTWPHP
jgi:hypothetical protein